MKYLDKDVFVIWNEKENRPALSENSFGNMIVYLTLEQAEAYIATIKELYPDLPLGIAFSKLSNN